MIAALVAVMLERGHVATRLPAQNLERARRFYRDKLGLEPSEVRPGGLLYRCAQGEFAVFQSAGAPSGHHTQIAWEVEDIEDTVDELRGRGVIFEEVAQPGLQTIDGIAEIDAIIPAKEAASEPRGSKIAKAICTASARWFADRIYFAAR